MSYFEYYKIIDYLGFVLLVSSVGTYYIYNKTGDKTHLEKSVVFTIVFLSISYMFYLMGENYFYYASNSYVYQIGAIIDSTIVNLPYKIQNAIMSNEQSDNPLLSILIQLGLLSYTGVFTLAILNIGLIQKIFHSIKTLIRP